MKNLVFTLLIIFFINYCHAQYKPGYYIDNDKNTHHGLIRHNLGSKPSIDFKVTKKQKAIEFTPDDIKGFVIEQDSYIVLRYFNLQFSNELIPVTADFVKVIEIGAISLYEHYWETGSVSQSPNQFVNFHNSGRISTYILKKRNYVQLKVVPNTDKKFKKEMADYFSDIATLKTAIEQGSLSYTSIPIIVRTYNSEKNSLSQK